MACSRYPEHDDGRSAVRVLPIGTKVRLLAGPFRGFEAEIASWSSADRCRLLVWMVNRNVAVEVHAVDIVAIEP
jgi:transcription antitermination factor NusG